MSSILPPPSDAQGDPRVPAPEDLGCYICRPFDPAADDEGCRACERDFWAYVARTSAYLDGGAA